MIEKLYINFPLKSPVIVFTIVVNKPSELIFIIFRQQEEKANLRHFSPKIITCVQTIINVYKAFFFSFVCSNKISVSI